MDNALSYITVLPSNEKELEDFKRLVKPEIMASNGFLMYMQLKFCKRLFDDLLNDEDIQDHLDDGL